MITVLKFLTNIFFFLFLAAYILVVVFDPGISGVHAAQKDGDMTAALWLMGIVIVVIWGSIIWVFEKLQQRGRRKK